jgi:GNAT superfamily N-acetyltransferase
MKIRPVIASDYKQVMQLYNGFVNEDRFLKYNNDSFHKVLNLKNSYIYVVEYKDGLVGFASFSIRSVVRYPKPIAELDELYVLPEFRKKGLGKKLLQKVIIKAKQRKCYRLFVESHYDHKNAHKLYEQLGFTNYGFHFIKNL